MLVVGVRAESVIADEAVGVDAIEEDVDDGERRGRRTTVTFDDEEPEVEEADWPSGAAARARMCFLWGMRGRRYYTVKK